MTLNHVQHQDVDHSAVGFHPELVGIHTEIGFICGPVNDFGATPMIA